MSGQAGARKPDKKIKAEFYMNHDLEMDWSIHLIWERNDKVAGKSILGVCIAEMFSTLGLVSHSIWEKIDDKFSKINVTI